MRTLGESEFVGPPCRVGELSLSGGQITMQQEVQREVFVRERDGVVGDEPQRLDVVFVVFGEACGGSLEMRASSVELATLECHHPQPAFDGGAKPLPLLIGAGQQ